MIQCCKTDPATFRIGLGVGFCVVEPIPALDDLHRRSTGAGGYTGEPVGEDGLVEAGIEA